MNTQPILQVASVLLSILFTFGGSSVNAQGMPGTRSPEAVRAAPERAQRLFDDYRSKYRGVGIQSVDTLVEVLNGGLPKSPANAASLRTLLVSRVSAEEKLALLRLLGTQFGPSDPTGMNQLILSDIRAAAQSQDPNLAREATYTYSRLPYLPDTLDLLTAAKARGLLDDTAYYGELAHLLPRARGANQVQLARMIRSSSNAYARDIVAMGFNGSLNSNYSAETRGELLPFFEAMEPRFGITVSRYDYGQGSDYSAWLFALATLKVPGTDTQRADFIIQKLSDPLGDPRKVIAVLISPRGPWLVATAGNKARFDTMLAVINRYPGQNPPQIKTLTELVDYAKSIIAGG